MLKEILQKDEFTRDDIIYLLGLSGDEELSALYSRADEVRKKYCGDAVHLRGIIEFSNICNQDCLYCGLRKSDNLLVRYRMTFDEIIQTAETIHQAGIKTIVLQSGEDDSIKCEEVYKIIKTIKAAFGTAITLSLGERNYEDYNLWRDAGADRYLLKHETANRKLYSIYHKNQSLEERIQHLGFLKSIGYQIGSGNLVGLPGQKIGDIADDILLCRELDVDMASFSPFIPSIHSPYRNLNPCELETVLKVMAVGRIVLKNAHIPATTALASLDDEGRIRGLQCGANVIMPNFTPHPYRENYLIYSNKKC